MTGSVLQVGISRGGIPKRAIAEGRLTAGGFEGDLWANPRIHGGPNQAVLLIAAEVIGKLRGGGFAVYPGALGENLTTVGLDASRWRIGQRFQAGEALIELTKVRAPCRTLDVYNSGELVIQKAIYDPRVKAGDTESPLWGFSGMYARVIRAGCVRADDIITLVDQAV